MTDYTKRYLLFTFPSYYAGGGWEDFVGAYASVAEAKDAFTSNEHAHIVDLETMEVVLGGNRLGTDTEWWEVKK